MKSKVVMLEGLRTLGWFGVFLCHYKGAFLFNEHWIFDNTPIQFLYSGNAFVRLLFIISGFVIAYKYFCKDCYDLILGDAIKRYFRLLPPIVFIQILVYFLMVSGALHNQEVAQLTGSESFLGMFNQFEPNFKLCLKEAFFSTYLFGANAYVGPLWTIVYEYLGVLFILALITIFKKSETRWLFYLVFLSVFSNYYNYFVIGMLISDIFVNTNICKKIKRFNLCFAILGFYMLSMVNLNDEIKYTRVIFGVGNVLFFIGVLSSDFFNKILGNNLMIFGGKIAYSAYLVHWPVIQVLSCGLFLLFFKEVEFKLLVWLIFVVTLVFIIVFSYLTEKYIEKFGAIMSSLLTSSK